MPVMHERVDVTQQAAVEFDAWLIDWLERNRVYGWFYAIERMALSVASLAHEADGNGVIHVSDVVNEAWRLRRAHGLTQAEVLRIVHNTYTSFFHGPVRNERHGVDGDRPKADEA